MRNFRKYDVYQESLNLVDHIYEISNAFPPDEKYGLKSQLTRAVVSIPSNIAEGSSRSSEKDFKRFIEISIGSAFEVEVLIEIASRRLYLSSTTREDLLQKVFLIQKRLNTLKTKLTP